MPEASLACSAANRFEHEQSHLSNRLISHTELGAGRTANKESILPY